DPKGVDGVFGKGTEDAVRLLQTRHGLPADGIVGPKTWAALGAGSENPADQGGRRLSARGAEFIARFEGCRLNLYDDPAGHCTIGVGHLVHRGRTDGSEPAEFRNGITRERALEMLQQDAESAAKAVEASVKVPLSQSELDALISFVFNIGAGAFRSSTLLTKLNAGDRSAVPAELTRWTKAGGKVLPGLVARREAEGQLFSTGRYP
ncbi:MAG TPA: glycoside hydrolase family protein, partial [Actinomycetota bacterium]|nr:glycoside hydrolase family protein [Actinomycetota bacterium]